MIKLTTSVTIDNPIAGDLEIQAGEFVLLTPVEQAGQAIGNRLKFFKGESFLDVREGVPYFTEILAKGISLARIRSIIRQTESWANP